MRTRFFVLISSLALLGTPAALALTSGAATHEAEAFVRSMAKGDFAAPEKHFTATMKQAAPPKRLAAIWAAKTAPLGPFRGLGATKAVAYQSPKIVFVAAEFKTSALRIKVMFNSTRKIAGLFFVPATASP